MRDSEQLGAKAVRLGYVTAEQVSEALEKQRSEAARRQRRPPLGLQLVEMGALTPAQLVTLLQQHNGADLRLTEDAIRLVATLHAACDDDMRIVMFTAVTQQTNVTAVTAQVGVAMALMDHEPILLVDNNFNAPALHKCFQTQQSPGLQEVIEGKAGLDEALFRTGISELSLLAAGECHTGIVGLLHSEEYANVLGELRRRFRLTIVNTSPILRTPEAAVLASRVDGVVVLAAAGRVHRADLIETKRMLDGLKTDTLGVVLTRGDPSRFQIRRSKRKR